MSETPYEQEKVGFIEEDQKNLLSIEARGRASVEQKTAFGERRVEREDQQSLSQLDGIDLLHDEFKPELIK